MPFRIVRNDITKMKVDAIVNTANPNVTVGRGVDEAIYSAAGRDKLLKEREKIGPMKRGEAAITPGFGLEAKYIIHTVGPKWDDEDQECVKKQLKDCYDNSMSLALEYGVKSIAFPLISTGTYAFPKDVGLNIAYDTISKYLYVSEMDVYLVVYDDEAFTLSKKLQDDIDEFIDSHYVAEAHVKYNAPAMSSGGGFYGSAPDTVKSADERRMLRNESPRSRRSIFRSVIQLGKEAAKDAFTREEDLAPEDKVEEMTFDAMSDYLVPDEAVTEKAANEDVFVKYKDLDDLLKHSGETFQDRLFRYIDERGMSDVEVYKKANISKQTFSKIKQPGHIPKKKNIFALALVLGLSVDETKDLLEAAGQAFSPSDKVDLVIQYCMYNGIYSMIEVEMILFEKFGETLTSVS